MEGAGLSAHRHHHRHHTQSRARDGVSLVFSFFLSIALVGMMVLTALRVGFAEKVSFLTILDDQYYEYVLDHIEDQSKYYTLPTGIDPAVLEDVFVLDEVRENIQSYVASLFGDYVFNPNVSAMHDRLMTNVRTAFASDGVEIKEGEEAEEVASTYVDQVTSFYSEMMRPSGLDDAVEVCRLYCKYYPFAMIGLGVLAALMVMLLVRLHHFVHRSLRYMAYAAGGAALMGFVVPAIVFVGGSYKGLNLDPQYFYHFGVSLIERVLTLCMMGSAVLVVVMLALAFTVAKLRSKVLKRKRVRRHAQA
ncbi:MAG: hypothetical protein Q4A07_04585 [Coriobacteriales bacterium]|nr:hypothetical protein [Coriobacteriales bacterium]